MPVAELFPHIRRRLSPWLAGALVALLLAAQALGQWHRLDHDSRVHLDAAQSHQHWGHGLDSSDCRALDQLGLHLGLGFAPSTGIDARCDAAPGQPLALAPQGSTRWRVQARAPPTSA